MKKQKTKILYLLFILALELISLTSETNGELLYNGIQLPVAWPPRLQIAGNQIAPIPPYLQHPPAVIPIDVGRQLFVDDFLIEKTDLQRHFHYPTKYEGNPIFKAETPTEKGVTGEMDKGLPHPTVSLFSDGFCYEPKEKRFRMWYQGGRRDGTLIATSEDGIHWSRLETDLEKGNNRAFPKRPKPVRHGNSISFDPFTQDLSQRYKMVIYEDHVKQEEKGQAYASADGIHWNLLGFLPSGGDIPTIFYNPFRKKWVISIRDEHAKRNGKARNYREHTDFEKAIQWTPLDEKGRNIDTSEEYEWTGTDPLDLPDPDMMARIPVDEIRAEAEKSGKKFEEMLASEKQAYGNPTQLFTMNAVAYESLMIGMFEILRGPSSGRVWDRLKITQRTDLHMAYSRDGFFWDRTDRTPFIPCTRKEGDWDRGFLHGGTGICTVMGDRLWFYYSGSSDMGPAGPMTFAECATGLAFLRRDGFASMDANEKSGTLTTRPITFRGKHLFVNLMAPKGELRAEVLDEEGKVIAPFSLENSISFTGDKTRQRLTWKGIEDLSSLSGKRVKFRFSLKNGELYAFWVSPDLSGASYGYVAAGGPEFNGLIDTVGGQ
ncbi:MAG: glycosyl hydrolase family 32 [Verrucomicrobiota bacterium]